MPLTAVGALLLTLAGCGVATSAQSTATPLAAAARTAALDRVRAVRPLRKTLTLTTVQPGRIDAFEETPLYSKLSGYVDHLAVGDGDHVQQNDVLTTIASPEVDAAMVEAEAAVEQAGAEVARAEAALIVARPRSTGRGRPEAAQAEAGGPGRPRSLRVGAEADRRPRRAGPSRESWSTSRDSRSPPRRRAAGGRSPSRRGRSRSVEAQAGVKQAEAELQVAQAAAGGRSPPGPRTQPARLAVDQGPLDGVVVRRSVDTGHFVQPASGSGTRPLLVVARVDKVRVSVDIPEAEAPLITCGEEGDPAEVYVQSLGRGFEARLTRCSWSLGDANRSLRTQIELSNEEQALRPGMFASVSIRLDERPDALVLPRTAVFQEAGETRCCRVVDGRIERATLRIGLRSGDEVEFSRASARMTWWCKPAAPA